MYALIFGGFFLIISEIFKPKKNKTNSIDEISIETVSEIFKEEVEGITGSEISLHTIEDLRDTSEIPSLNEPDSDDEKKAS